MAFRLSQSVLKGTIDNRTRGKVIGSIWLVGRLEPIQLSLTGNCLPDIAGCELAFTNPDPHPGELVDLFPHQHGRVGEMTSSRRKVSSNQPVESQSETSTGSFSRTQATVDNCLYLEWYSQENGRVIIESPHFELRVSEHEWLLPSAYARARPSSHGMDEFAWESFMRLSEDLAERLASSMERHKHHPNRDDLVARDMGWQPGEDRGEADVSNPLLDDLVTPCGPDGMLLPNPCTEGKDWVRDENGEVAHPLTFATRDFALRVWKYCSSLGLFDGQHDDDLEAFIFTVEALAGKLGTTLNGLAYDDSPDRGYLVASLKRALSCLHDSLSLLPAVERKRLIPEKVREFRQELFHYREQILSLMEEYRVGSPS